MGVFAKAKTSDKGVEKLLGNAGLNYVSLIELGCPFLDLEDWQPRYTRLLEAAGDVLVERLLCVPGPFCLMCCEKDPAQCHRRLIAEYLRGRGWIIEHIL